VSLPTQSRILRCCLNVALLACLLALALRVASQLSAYNVQDDAYIYARYADNILQHGAASWDPRGEPTYGATSHLHLLVVIPMRFLLPEVPALAMGLASLVSGILALCCIALLVTRGIGATAQERPWLLLLVALPIAQAGERVAAHLTDGMDTMAALASLSLLLLAWTRQQREPTRANVALLAACGGACYASRPDLALFALIVPAAVACFGTGLARRLALATLAATLAVIGAACAAAWLYYGTPVPLSFFIKSLSSRFVAELGPHYAGVPWIQVSAYATSYWLLILVIAVDCVFNFRRFVSGGGGLRLGVLVATLLYAAYFSFAVIQVVAFHQRFYYPTLPALCFLGAWSARDLVRDLGPIGLPGRGMLTPALRGLGLLLLLRFVAPPVLDSVQTLRDEMQRDRFARFDLMERYRRQSSRFWFGLDRVSALPDDLVLATTEIGHPAALNPRKRVVDMVGLNESGFARGGFSAERLLTQYQPDICYMPHEHYKLMNDQILGSPLFAQAYELFGARELNASMAVALRRDSRYYEELRAIMTEPRPSE